MELIGFLVLFIMVLSYLIPYVFIKTRSKKAIKDILEKSNKYNEIQNFIDLKRYEFNSYEKSTIAILGIFIVLFLAINLTGIGSMIIYLTSAFIFIAILSTYINLRKLQGDILRLLYQKKDRI